MEILIVENVWMGAQPYKFFDKFLLTAFSILPTLYARQLAAITPKEHEVIVVNERYAPINFQNHYDLVNINFTTSTAPRAYEIADAFRQKGVVVVLSGLHASAVPKEAKQHADSVLLGRGELNWLDLLSDINKKNLQPFYKAKAPEKSTILPPTQVTLPGFVMTGALEATRGCPYGCTFCPEGNLAGGSTFYKRSVEEVIQEIKSLPQKTLMFYDASLTIDPTYTKNLFKNMKGLHKRFFCNGNANVLAQDQELVQLSKEAGCVAWLIGFESISQKTLDTIGKSTNTASEYERAIHNIHQSGMAVIGCFMFGFDTETSHIFRETLKEIMRLQIDVADFCILTPFPGTPLFQQLENEGRLQTKNWSHYNLKTPVFSPKQMTAEELVKGVQFLYQEFYSLPYTLQRVMRNLCYGTYPLFVVLARNSIATMNSRRIFS